MNYSEKGKIRNGDNGEPITILVDVLKESVGSFRYFVKKNMRNISTVFQVFIPHICIAGIHMTGYHFVWLVMPFIMYYISFVFKKVDMVYNNRTVDNIPIPFKRFTEVDADGDVISIEESRLQELLLYLNELEDTLEGLGKL